MVAVTNSMTDYNLKFRNINGALKLQLYGEYSVKKIKIEGNNGEILADDYRELWGEASGITITALP